MNILFLVGISGSGKSTFAEEFLQENQKYLCINRDDICKSLVKTLDGYYKRKDLHCLELIVNNIIDEIIHNAVDIRYNLIIDNTNLNEKYINELLELVNVKLINCLGSNYKRPNINFKLFDINVNEAKTRIVKRDNYAITLNSNHENICSQVNYIDKQYSQYKEIKKYLLQNYKEQII